MKNKKIYISPLMLFVDMEPIDCITTSPVVFTKNTSGGGQEIDFADNFLTGI